MKKSIIIMLNLTILFGCTSQPKIDYTELEYTEWSAQQKLAREVQGAMPGIDSVIAMTDVMKIDGVKYVGFEVLYSKVLHWEYLGDLYFDELGIRNVPPFDTAKFFETFEKEYGQIYGVENVERIEDNDYFRSCIPCKRMYVIKNIRLRMYGVLQEKEDKWSIITDSLNIKNLPINSSQKQWKQGYLNENVPKDVQVHFTEVATYFAVTEFKGMIKLDPKDELQNTIGNYITAINDGNGMEELKMTHPKIVNGLRIDAEINNTSSFLDSSGILSQNMKLGQVLYISPVISSKDSKYTKLMIMGSFELDFSTTEVTPDISYLFSMLPTIYKEKYGVSNVNADNETKIISVNNIETSIYAVYNTQIGGWKFSTIPYNPEGVSLDGLWEITRESIAASPEEWVQQMERKKNRIDVIIPSDILLKLD